LGEDFAVVALPVPLNTECNRLVQTTNPANKDACQIARIAIAVWLADPEQFHQFHDWIMNGASAPSADEVREEAAKRVGSEQLQAQLDKQTADQYLAKNIELYQRAGAGTVPKILVGPTSIVGEINSADKLAEVVQRKPRR
jgi:protein-disulfide isomerase